jgi:hypothetical protein
MTRTTDSEIIEVWCKNRGGGGRGGREGGGVGGGGARIVGSVPDGAAKAGKAAPIPQNSKKPGTAESAIVTAGLSAPTYWNGISIR